MVASTTTTAKKFCGCHGYEQDKDIRTQLVDRNSKIYNMSMLREKNLLGLTYVPYAPTDKRVLVCIFGLGPFFLSIWTMICNFRRKTILGAKIEGRPLKWPDLYRAGFLVGIFGLGPFFRSIWTIICNFRRKRFLGPK